MAFHTSPPQSAVLTLPSAAELSQRNTEAALLWRTMRELVRTMTPWDDAARQTTIKAIDRARTTAIESAAYLAAETDSLHPANREQLARIYGLLTDLETLARTLPEGPGRDWNQATATLLRATLDEPSAPGGQTHEHL